MKLKMKSWKYLVLDNVDSEKLNELGINGWELVNVLYIPSFDISGFAKSYIPLMKFYFKKQVLSNKD